VINYKNDRSDASLQVDHKKGIHFTLAIFLVPVSVPPLEGMEVGVSLVLCSMLDLSWIDLIPVNKKIHNLLGIILKKMPS
jgi:hypothetical protein